MIVTTCLRFMLGVAIGLAIGAPSFVAAGDPPKTTQEKQDKKAKGADTIPEPAECEDIKAGTPDSRSQAASRKDCEASKRLGAGTGTSSGTGSGKMGSGSGSR
jgi:hypothetical protein